MARIDTATIAQLVARARHAMPNLLDAVGRAPGWSKRTLQRWQAAEQRPSDNQLAELARLVHPHDAELAAEVAAAAGTTLVSLGLEAAQAPPAPAPPPRDLVVDAVVCAAADSTNVPPSAVRGLLLAAFRRARELGLTVDEVERALGQASPAPRPSP